MLQEGLFSDGGCPAEIEDIMAALDSGRRDLPGSVFSVASTLLTFLAALETPVVPAELHQQCMVAHSTSQCKRVRH